MWRKYATILSLLVLSGTVVGALSPLGWSSLTSTNPTKARFQETGSTNADPAGTIDGSKEPDLIPDEVAFRLYFLAVAGPENATDVQRRNRARLMVLPVQLSEDETVALVDAVFQYKSQIDSIDSQAAEIHSQPAPTPGTLEWDRLLQLGEQRAQALRDTLSLLDSRLTLGGMESLRAYVRSQKQGMKIIPE